MPNTNSLYELIKQKSQERNCPLKIISGWDEVTFAFRPTAVYKFASSAAPFQQFFEEFWDNVNELITSSSDGTKKFVFEGKGEIKEAYERFTNLFEERKKAPAFEKNAEKYQVLNVVHEMPFLSISEDLLKCLKEDLISELVIETRTRNTSKGKLSMVIESRKKRFANSFGHFPNCKLDIKTIEVIDGKHKPFSWDAVKEKHPDFDVCINDDPPHIELIKEDFPDRIYVAPDYKFNKQLQGENIYRFKTVSSDLKDSDFAVAAEEYKQKQAERQQVQVLQPAYGALGSSQGGNH